jgi:arylsulfatase A-like enzyme
MDLQRSILAGFLFWGTGFAQEVAPSKPPNMVLIVADDMGYADVGAFGCKDFSTPNLDRLAGAGVRFTNAYVTGPICVPSRTGIFTGRYPQRWGIYGNNDGYTPGGMRQTAQEQTFAEVFQKAGYATALIGKWHLSGNGTLENSAQESRPEQNGFEEVAVIGGGMSSYRPGTLLYQNGGSLVSAPEYLTDYFGRRAVGFIERNREKPFLLCLTFNAVHAPLQAQPGDVQSHAEIGNMDRRTYAGMAVALDRNVGRVLDALNSAGVEDNTIVAFLSDNGGPAHDAAGHSRNMANNGPLRGHKFDVLEGGIRTPMVFRWPARFPAGKTFEGISSSMDIAATFLAAANLLVAGEKPPDGVDLTPFLSGQKSGDPHETLFWECNWFRAPDCAARRGTWKVIQTRTGSGGAEPDKWELYDLSRDIGETRDLAAQHPEVVREMDEAYRKWRSRMVPAHTAQRIMR